MFRRCSLSYILPQAFRQANCRERKKTHTGKRITRQVALLFFAIGKFGADCRKHNSRNFFCRLSYALSRFRPTQLPPHGRTRRPAKEQLKHQRQVQNTMTVKIYNYAILCVGRTLVTAKAVFVPTKEHRQEAKSTSQGFLFRSTRPTKH